MADNVISPNMGLVIPLVGQEAGPQYAQDVNTSLFSIDAHDHTPGSGVQITPQGLNISSDLPLNSNNLGTVRSVQFVSQVAALPAISPDIENIYVSGVDLYYNDGNGNQIRMTSGGNVNSGAGSISGLVSPASASYSAGTKTFIWQSDASQAANMDMGAIILRKLTTSSPGITIAPSASLSSNYTITLPAVLPSVSNILTLDNSGNLGYLSSVGQGLAITNSTISVPNQGITQAMHAPMAISAVAGAGDLAVSPSSGNFTTGVNAAIPNFSVTITTTGRPVRVGFMADGSGSTQSSKISGTGSADYVITNGVTDILRTNLNGIPAIPASSVEYIDQTVNGLPGTYTYTASVIIGSGSATVAYSSLFAYEI